MSISSINNSAQTGLVPNSLLGYSSNGVSALEILPTSITIAGLLTTTPIYVGISATGGLTTTNPTGLDVNCDFNMNENNITNVGGLSGTENGLTISNNGGGGNTILITSSDDITLTTEDNIILTAEDNITISNSTGFTNTISLNKTTGDTTIQSANGAIIITAGNGDAGNSGITLNSPEGNITLNASLYNIVSTDSYIYAQQGGFYGPMYHNDQPTTASNYYLTFVQSNGISGYYTPNFDSATLTYNPSTNLLAVAGLQLSGATIAPTFTAGVLTLGCNESSSRQFQFAITANMVGLSLTNRRTNGVYTCSINNTSGSTWTINHILSGSSPNKTDYNTSISIANGDFAVLTARTLLSNGIAYNFVSVVKFA